MSIFSLFGAKKQSELALVLDVGSSSVGGALVFLNSGMAPRIIYSIREPILLERETNFERFFNLTLSAVERVAERVSKAGLGSPRKTFVILSSPWYASQTRIITLAKDKPFIFTPKLYEDLVKKEVALFEEDYVSKFGYTGEKVRTLEVKTMRITLNGYEAEEPLGQNAESLNMALFISVSPEQVLDRIDESIARHLHKKNTRFSSFVMASFVVTRDVFTHEDNFLLVDLGGEVTEISMIKKRSLRESISFPFGTNFILRGIAAALKSTLEEAKSFLALYKAGHAVGTLAQKLDPVLKDLKSTWLKKFQESLANLSNDILIPSTIYLAVDREYGEFFKEIIKTEQFNQYTLTESKFEVNFLGLEELNTTVTFRQGVERDPFIIIASIYINKHFH